MEDTRRSQPIESAKQGSYGPTETEAEPGGPLHICRIVTTLHICYNVAYLFHCYTFVTMLHLLHICYFVALVHSC